jgi:NAD(P)-dependent dehydrogenase (short-subunit alcohol dehydrogenase family)
MRTLDGKVAIVTGGTGALGGAVVGALLGAGAAVVAPHRRAGELEQLRTQLGLAADAPLSGMMLDLTDEAAVAQAFADAATRQGGVDILVNIAGGFGGGKPVHATPWSVWQQQLDQNLKTTVLACAAAVPHMLARGGAIINVGTRTASPRRWQPSCAIRTSRPTSSCPARSTPPPIASATRLPAAVVGSAQRQSPR